MHIQNNNRAVQSVLFLTIISALVGLGFILPTLAGASGSVQVWWPTTGASVSGTQPFKAMLSGYEVSEYEMYWQVDDGQLNKMENNDTDHPHKEASVDLASWTWHGSGPYVVTFVAKKDGSTIAEESVNIVVANGLPTWSGSSNSSNDNNHDNDSDVRDDNASDGDGAQDTQASSTSATASSTGAVSEDAALAVTLSPVPSTVGLYVNPDSRAAEQARTWTHYPTGERVMAFLAAQPTAVWLGDWTSDVRSAARDLTSRAEKQNQTPVIVAYNLPQRDCGGFSAGGTNNPAGYRSWIDALAGGIGSSRAIVILEPDSLAQIDCLSQGDQGTRLDLLRYAVDTLKKNSGTRVYLDAGHSNWIDTGVMADRLTRANIKAADGFSLNVSNFVTTSDEVRYGTALSKKVEGKHFVIDTARNGNGTNGEWCNPSGRAVGETPTFDTNNRLVDAYLWIKTPGESDGYCNGGPSAGSWWPEYAVNLVQNSRYRQ